MSSILVTCGNKTSANKYYIPALRLAGWKGEVVLVSPGDLAVGLAKQAGLLLCGGADIHPCLWDEYEELHPRAEPDIGRDVLEAPLVREAWEKGLPIFGVCRGAQMLNVALGGSLIQDIADYFDIGLDVHKFGSAEDSTPHHEVSVDPQSRLAEIVGATALEVNTRHHQAVMRVAPALKPVAWHHPTSHLLTGSLIEAVEAEDRNRFALGVQWHPENLVKRNDKVGKTSLKLFQAFVGAINGVQDPS